MEYIVLLSLKCLWVISTVKMYLISFKWVFIRILKNIVWILQTNCYSSSRPNPTIHDRCWLCPVPDLIFLYLDLSSENSVACFVSRSKVWVVLILVDYTDEEIRDVFGRQRHELTSTKVGKGSAKRLPILPLQFWKVWSSIEVIEVSSRFNYSLGIRFLKIKPLKSFGGS